MPAQLEVGAKLGYQNKMPNTKREVMIIPSNQLNNKV